MAENIQFPAMNLIRTSRFSKCLFWPATVWSPFLSRLCHNQAGPPSEINPNIPFPIEAEPGRAKDICHRRRLIWPDLDENFTGWRQDLAGAGGNAPIGVEPVGAAVKGEPRIMACHFPR
jgi:hypothetical protein